MMGVISRVTYIPGGGLKSVTRLDTRKRNIIIVLAAGAPTPECADDALKLLRRMMGSLQNGGFMEEIIAVGINAKGAIVFTKEEWMAAARKYGVQDIETYAENAMARNKAVLDRAYDLGQKLAE
jgi:peroxiredoxin